MSKHKAISTERQYDEAECAVIRWRNISIPAYYFVEKKISRFSQKEILKEEQSVMKLALSKLVCEMAGIRWGGHVFTK